MLARKPGLSHDDFERHWRDVHGPLIASTPDVSRHVVAYEQHPRTHAPGRFTGASGFDGVAVMTFESHDAFDAFMAEPTYAPIREDERRFIDLERMVVLVVDEPRQPLT